jgi:hypothetical protein
MIVFQKPTTSYKFTKKTSGISSDVHSESPKKIQIVLSEDCSLEELLETFQDFLTACGFYLAENESLAIIKMNESDREEEEKDEGED